VDLMAAANTQFSMSNYRKEDKNLKEVDLIET
jgi:hypothetical protein